MTTRTAFRIQPSLMALGVLVPLAGMPACSGSTTSSESECPADERDENGDCPAACAADSSDCGANATCDDSSGSVECVCDSGYQDNDADGECSATCETANAECGANATCTDGSGDATCACDEGFEDDDGDGDCTETCEGDGCTETCDTARLTCGANSSCVDADGMPTCACDAGFQDNDGDGDCALTCASAPECGENANCSDASGTAECSCDAGFQDNDSDGECTENCDDITCNTTETCSDETGTAACICADGFQDNDGDGQCTANCDGITCNTTEVCSDETGTAACICADGFQDNDGDGTCLPACDASGSACGPSGVCRDESGFIRCLPVVAGLLAHYDAQDSSALTIGPANAVSQWNDLSGNDHHLTVNGTAPTYDVDINSHAAMSFAGGSALQVDAVPLETEVTVFAVIQWKVANTWGSIAHHGHRDVDWSLEQNGGSQGVSHFQSNNDNNGAEINLTADRNYILVGHISGNTRTYTVHSVERGTEVTSANGVTISAGDKTLYLGKSEINESSNAYIGEFVYYSRALSSEDQRQVTNYLRDRWSIHEHLSAGKRYAYRRHLPGHDPQFYWDDTHLVHISGLGTYSTGQLTDGLFADGVNDVVVPSAVVALGWTGPDGSQPTDVIIDLEAVSRVEGLRIGTSVRGMNGAFGGAAPDDVDVSFSITGDLDPDFGTPVNYPLWNFATEPLSSGGHHEKYLLVDSQAARFVKLSFDGAVDGNRYMLDEVTVLGATD